MSETSITARPRVSVIHATSASLTPLEIAFRRDFPEAEIRSTVDDRLFLDLPKTGEIPRILARRLERLIEFVLGDDTQALLVACSSYSDTIDHFRDTRPSATPIVKADEPLYAEVAAQGFRRIGLILTLQAAVKPAVDGLRAAYNDIRMPSPDLDVRCVTEAAPFEGGRASVRRRDLLLDVASGLCACGAEAIVLGQYSLTDAHDFLRQSSGIPVFSGPSCAAMAMRKLLIEGVRSPTQVFEARGDV